MVVTNHLLTGVILQVTFEFGVTFNHPKNGTFAELLGWKRSGKVSSFFLGGLIALHFFASFFPDSGGGYTRCMFIYV